MLQGRYAPINLDAATETKSVAPLQISASRASSDNRSSVPKPAVSVLDKVSESKMTRVSLDANKRVSSDSIPIRSMLAQKQSVAPSRYVLEKETYRDAERKPAPEWIDSTIQSLHESSESFRLETMACHPLIVACCVGLLIVGFLWFYRPSFVMSQAPEGMIYDPLPDWRWVLGIGVVGGVLTYAYPSISESLKQMTIQSSDA